jgi:membrane-bound PQQ-dependent dehydrogenase (glucose/quinate/shikimate family)
MPGSISIAAASLALLALAAGSVTGVDWTEFAGDPGGSHHSPLAQINPRTVSQLQRVWRYKLPPLDNPYGRQLFSFEATPLKIDDALYFCAPDNRVTALDAETGALRWSFDARDRKWTAFRVCRGVAAWRAPDATTVCPDRIITATTDARLIALDRRTGKPCAGFGANGVVDLLQGMGEVRPGGYMVTSAPLVVGKAIIIGGGVTDNGRSDNPSGVIRAFDAVTGTLLWAWDMGRPTGTALPPQGQQYTRNTPNDWAPPSADPALGLVYIPTGNSNPDNYGAHRSAVEEKYSSAIVALDVATGQPRWSFQTVHHDLWDYDVGSQPTLFDFAQAGRPIPALIAATKRGQLFVLDRRTGQPLTRVVERPVPQGAGRGDWTAKTQPYSVDFPWFEGEPVTEASMWGLTPLDQLWCRLQFRKARYDGSMTPPADGKPWLYSPGWMGGMDWGGVSIDHDRGIMVTTTMHIANYDRFLTPEDVRRDPSLKRSMQPQMGSPYAGVIADYFHSPLGVPCQEPPYGRLNAVDMRAHKLLWSIPLGTAEHSGPLALPFLRVPFAIPMGNVTMGGSLVTRGGLVFIGGSLDQHFRAFDIRTGRELWNVPIEAPAFASPMTYVAPRSLRQMVVVSVGGFNKYGPDNGLYVDAYALPLKH